MTATLNPASDKQVSFIRKLATERQTEPITIEFETLSRHDASRIIERLLTLPYRPRPVAGRAPVEVGMYRLPDGTICKVQRSRQGNLYAKRLVPINGQRLSEINEVVQWTFQYESGLIRDLTADMKLTLEEAKAFGIRYGVCCVCSATLSDARSVAAGIGPVCARRVR